MSKKNASKKSTQTATQSSKVKVLYQNLGGRWYAFTAIGDEVFFGMVPVKQSIKDTKKKQATKSNRSRNTRREKEAA